EGEGRRRSARCRGTDVFRKGLAAACRLLQVAAERQPLKHPAAVDERVGNLRACTNARGVVEPRIVECAETVAVRLDVRIVNPLDLTCLGTPCTNDIELLTGRILQILHSTRDVYEPLGRIDGVVRDVLADTPAARRRPHANGLLSEEHLGWETLPHGRLAGAHVVGMIVVLAA